MPNTKLQDIIDDFKAEEFVTFFRQKTQDKGNFRIRQELLPHYNDTDFSDFLKLGQIEFAETEKLVCITAKVSRDLSERSGKKAQYEKAKRILKEMEVYSVGIFIFYDMSGNFRFSLIYPESVGSRRQWSNFRRFTYFVSSELTNKTFLQRIGDGNFSSIDGVKDAFSVEKVTKEFYLQYRRLFEVLTEDLSKNHSFLNEAEKNSIKTDDFAKKLLGQIVFLYFVQKKGWLGVPSGGKWGEGDKNFMGNLFKGATSKNANFYNDYLEKLFYNTLNNPRRDSADPSFSKDFNSRIPFLNGGLFESEYDWENSTIHLDNKIFKDVFEIFDRYNFTVEEESPDDKEVAVDPEMLGKVFENLLPENLRKGKGTYYTPREIVHYMCQESLINYLATNHSNITEANIRNYIFYSGSIENFQNQKAESFTFGQYKELDDLLNNIKAVDPACGSGAFLVTMLNLIVKLRSFLQTTPDYKKIPAKSEYQLKKEAIQNCIFGVDIDPGAIEIAKLRLWLSLVVDYGLEDIEPLPNLDYRLMCGDSLLEEFEGVKFYGDDEETSQATLLVDSQKQQKIAELKKKVKEYFDIHDDEEKRKKRSEINDIKDWLIRSALEEKRREIASQRKSEEAKANMLNQKSREAFVADWSNKFLAEAKIEGVLNNLHNPKKEKPFFIWKLEFMDVFEDKGGFDVVIGNPPYLRIQGIQLEDPELARKYKILYKSATGAFDLYVLFLERGLSLLNSKGILNFILPHKWVNSAFGIGIRRLIHNNNSGKKMISFGAHQVFNASNYTSLLWLTSEQNKKLEYFEFSKDLMDNRELEHALNELTQKDYNLIDTSILDENPWVLADANISKVIEKLSKQPLKVKDVFIKIFQGIATSDDKAFVLTHRLEKGNTVILFSKSLNKEIEIEKNLLRPFLMGKDVHRYQQLTTKNYIVFPYLLEKGAYQLMTTDHLSKNYPLGWSYLVKNKERLQKREHGIFKNTWWCFSRPQNMDFFEREKIITPEISNGSNMTIDYKGSFFHTTKCYSLLKRDSVKEDYKFFLGILNSQLMWFFLINTGYVLRGGYFTFKTNYLEPFPLPKVNNPKEHNQIVKLVDEIYNLTQSSTNNSEVIRNLEKQIDQLVYKLYDLTPEEIAIVESKK